MIWATFLSDKV